MPDQAVFSSGAVELGKQTLDLSPALADDSFLSARRAMRPITPACVLVRGVAIDDDTVKGLFDGVLSLFGAGLEKDPVVAWEVDSEDKPTQAARAKFFLERLALKAAVGEPTIGVDFAEEALELKGIVQGMPLTVRIRFDGRLDEMLLGYADALAALDVRYSTEEANVPSKSDDEDERRYYHGLGVWVEGPREEKEFMALPTVLQHEIAEGVRTHRVMYFRSREEGMDVDLHGALNKPDGMDRLAAVIALSAKVAKARIILHHRKSKAERSSEIEPSIYDGISELAFGACEVRLLRGTSFPFTHPTGVHKLWRSRVGIASATTAKGRRGARSRPRAATCSRRCDCT